ncbi:MAG: tryptophan synthase subunit beta [Bacteroidota bacterium]|jgi:tryptophan synthase beta chain|nr:tryptophan synthase subunit beta [Bacteroidota bacterium]
MTQHPIIQDGYYGEFGGQFIPEMLRRNFLELEQAFEEAWKDPEFKSTYAALLRDFVGRPTPLQRAERWSERCGTTIWFKREDLAHTGAHKINNAVGQVLLARRMGKRHIIAETGAGQHGVATATACAWAGLPCTVFMGAEDMERQQPNVERMRLLGAEVRAAKTGSQTLKDATNEAMRHWIAHPNETHYVIGSAVGPHPYPMMVAEFHGIIGEETFAACENKGIHPTHLVACLGGGSNALGLFLPFLEEEVRLIGVEAAGEGVDSGRTAATIERGSPGILHGAKTMILQDEEGQIEEAHSISAGLDYPGIGPLHAHLASTGRLRTAAATDEEAVQAGLLCTRLEGILPALETAHALAWTLRADWTGKEEVILNLSGRGDKDLKNYIQMPGER